MVFSSLAFLFVFLPVVFALNCVLPRGLARNILLVVASLVFYAYGEPVFVLLMLFSTVANYLFGRFAAPGTEGEPVGEYPLLARKDTRAGSASQGPIGDTPPLAPLLSRKAVLIAAIAVNLGLLVVFKYADMLVGTINAITGLALPLPQIGLPVGISFFTFQALSYVIDVYRGDAEPAESYLDVLLYVSFFPQLIAGPIVKYHDVAEQIRTRENGPIESAQGLRRFCFGLAKKVLIANQLAAIADALYGAPAESVWAATAWLAVISYLLQIYFDFSAYSDMAIGLGHMFGFTFQENFNYPYVATSIQDFWRRWHISLSTWFKEYVYIPLGGNRKGKARAAFNRMVVFFLCGLWHGASWTFVAWGVYHGLFLLLEQFVPALKRMPKWLGHIYALVVVCFGWILFRAETFEQAIQMAQLLFTPAANTLAQAQLLMSQLGPLSIAALVAGVIGSLPWRPAIQERLKAHPVPALEIASYVIAALLLALCVLELSAGGYNPFIYFRF